jgi:hypothetical protein
MARLAGLGSDRLDGAARHLQRRGWLSITLALFTPGVRNAAVPACGLAGLSFGVFLPALLLASGLDLALHFAIGAVGGSLVGALGMNAIVIVVALVVLAIAGLAGWRLIARGRSVFGAWQTTSGPACLALGALASQANPLLVLCRRGARVFTFDPDRVAELETAGWRAYYQRRWGRLLRLVVTLCQEQFHIPFPMSLAAAYYTTRASLAWAPLDPDLRAVEAWYRRFYGLVRRYGGLRFDPEQVAALELEYNVVHRELVGRSDKARFVDTMTRLHSAVFGLLSLLPHVTGRSGIRPRSGSMGEIDRPIALGDIIRERARIEQRVYESKLAGN